MAIAAATATACVASLVGGFIFALIIAGGFVEGWIAGGFYVGLVASLASLVICPILFLIAGLPLYALSFRNGWVSAAAYVATGATISFMAAIFAWHAFPTDRYFASLLVFVGGTAATFAFWKVARPDLARPR